MGATKRSSIDFNLPLEVEEIYCIIKKFAKNKFQAMWDSANTKFHKVQPYVGITPPELNMPKS